MLIVLDLFFFFPRRKDKKRVKHNQMGRMSTFEYSKNKKRRLLFLVIV